MPHFTCIRLKKLTNCRNPRTITRFSNPTISTPCSDDVVTATENKFKKRVITGAHNAIATLLPNFAIYVTRICCAISKQIQNNYPPTFAVLVIDILLNLSNCHIGMMYIGRARILKNNTHNFTSTPLSTPIGYVQRIAVISIQRKATLDSSNVDVDRMRYLPAKTGFHASHGYIFHRVGKVRRAPAGGATGARNPTRSVSSPRTVLSRPRVW